MKPKERKQPCSQCGRRPRVGETMLCIGCREKRMAAADKIRPRVTYYVPKATRRRSADERENTLDTKHGIS